MAGGFKMSENSQKKKISIGLLMDSFDVPNWTYLLLKKIEELNCAEIKLIVLNDAPKIKKSRLHFIITHWQYLLYMAYMKLEDMLIKLNPNAFESKDARHILSNVPVIKVRPRQIKYFDWIEDSDIEKIKQYKIDVFIRLGFAILKGKILESSKCGVWSFHHGDNHVNRGGPPGFWEVFENNPITGSVLQILTEDLDNGLILYRSYSSTDNKSVKKNRNGYYWKTLSFIPRKLKELHRLGEEDFINKVKSENRNIRFYCNRLYRDPKNHEFIIPFFRHMGRIIKSGLYSLFFFDQWILMYDLRNGISSSFWRFKKIIPPRDRFWADPHVIYRNNLYYIFIEEFVFGSYKGHISLLVMDENGKYESPVKIIDRPYHLSYPFVFEWDGAYYMIPESSANSSIELYKCVEFPHKWEFYKNLMRDIKAIDNTLFHHQGKWWLFTNIKENEGHPVCDDELSLFYSDNPLSGNWKAHPQNPIISDIRRARSAGKIFEYKGNIYRPSQDCSKGYGHSLKFNQIVLLTEKEYQEKEIDSIEPDWDRKVKSIHTFNHENMLTIIDGQLRRFKFIKAHLRFPRNRLPKI